MGGFEVNSYVVHAPEGDVVVDAGAEPEEIFAALRAPVVAILITHGHADHVGAIEDVRRETGATVYMHHADAEAAGMREFEPLQDGEGMALAGQGFYVLHTPGHSPGSVSFLLGSDQIVGDLILPGSVGRTDLGGASWEQIEVSLRRIMPYWEPATHLYAGHGNVMAAMEELETNPYLPLGVL